VYIIAFYLSFHGEGEKYMSTLFYTYLAPIHLDTHTYTCICKHTRNALFNLILTIMHDVMFSILCLVF